MIANFDSLRSGWMASLEGRWEEWRIPAGGSSMRRRLAGSAT